MPSDGYPGRHPRPAVKPLEPPLATDPDNQVRVRSAPNALHNADISIISDKILVLLPVKRYQPSLRVRASYCGISDEK
jgi:hypothetical protein